jgi:hypothetical protein
VLDIAIAYNRYKFLGNEFLTWLWFIIETGTENLRRDDADFVSIAVGNRMVLENTRNNAKETITIKGDNAGLEEARLAVKKGALVAELHLSCKTGAQHFEFSLKGESLNISSLKLPETGPIETQEDFEGVVLEKIYLIEKVVALANGLFSRFVHLRLSDTWDSQTKARIRKWAGSI